jgi:hypothetical protein
VKNRNTTTLWFASIATIAILFGALACENGSDGKQGPQGPPAPPPPPVPTSTKVSPLENAPMLIVEILELGGASGAGGEFAVGDTIGVRYRMEKRDGTPWLLEEMTSGIALVSGPTFSYQRVVPTQSDVLTQSIANADGTFSYMLPPIPAVYAAPFNDTSSFGAGDGELTGQPLLGGTYTLGLSISWRYTVEGQAFQRVGEATRDFVLGLTQDGTIEPREVTKIENCNQCHVELRAHQDRYRDLTMCLLCHTVGAEDGNDPGVAGGTPGVTIDSRVMFHRIHNAAHLPSVLGVSSFPNGLRQYGVAPEPLQYIAADNSVRDFSSVRLGVFPNERSPMPKDFGYGRLGTAEQGVEDQILAGVTSCFVCHGDPDGSGPLTAPFQGDLIEVQPTRAACGACHDDVDFANNYVSNLQIMPPQPDDSQCTMCHEQSGGQLSVQDGHRHPLRDSFFNPGINFAIGDFQEAPGANGNGVIDPGESIALSVTLRDDTGADLPASSLDTITALISGPTTNNNLIANARVPSALLSGAQPYNFLLPEARSLEFVGDSTAAPGEVFTTAFAPHLNLPGALTTVSVRTGTAGGSSVLTAAVPAQQSFVDVADASGFARDDFVVIDDGVLASEEYLRIQFVDGNRLWFAAPGDPLYAPGPRLSHAFGAAIDEVQLTPQTLGAQYSLDVSTGAIGELTEFGAGNAVVVGYTSPFVMPATYSPPLNASPDVGEAQGSWSGKNVVDGTYALGIWGSRAKTLSFAGQNNSYRLASQAATREFQVGGTTAPSPYSLIASGSSCSACHQDLSFHDGGDRGFATCILCHGGAGAEDRPRYVAANAPATPGETISFRALVHKLHRGKSLATASTWSVVGAGPAPYPDNFDVATYEHVGFPAMPGATSRCSACHGAGNTSWFALSDRNHPTQQGSSVLAWDAACGACHDSVPAQAHIQANTSPTGVESCQICHDPGEFVNVQLMHKNR